MPHNDPPFTVLFQSAKLGDRQQIAAELDWAARLLAGPEPIGRIYGVSGGALPALALGLALAARRPGSPVPGAAGAVQAMADRLRTARGRDLQGLNLNPLYGPFNLRPLRRWLAARLRAWGAADGLRLSELGVPLYLCALDRDGTFTLFGPPDQCLQFTYGGVHVGPPRDAPLLEAARAALSTLLASEPVCIDDEWFRDCRPPIPDAGAIVADLESADPRPLRRRRPHTPIRDWPLNWITSSFIMHSHHERNQPLLAAYDLDLRSRQAALRRDHQRLLAARPGTPPAPPDLPTLGDIDLPYIGSTEAFTNMRQSVQNKAALIERFRALLAGQLDGFPFDRPANLIYGAGGFSGILAGLVTTRAVEAGFASAGGQVQQVYGVSAGVLNGFFHAVQLAAARHPDLYTPAAHNALADLERFMATVSPGRIAAPNLRPWVFWRGWANLGPLEAFLIDRLAAYTGSRHAGQIRFDDIGLPFTVAAARSDGFTDFLGPAADGRRMRFAGRELRVRPAPVVRAMIAGWSMNTYIVPTRLGDQDYRDGGGTFYDPGLFAACLDESLINLLNIHLDEPEGHSYNLPPRPNLLKLLFETHNYNFPEERRRMRALTRRLFEHYRLRARHAAALRDAPPAPATAHPLPPDFRQDWNVLLEQDVLETSAEAAAAWAPTSAQATADRRA